MTNSISDADARLALNSVEERRRQIIAEIDLPAWYWWGLAIGWVVLGVLSDTDNAWVTFVATLTFGAVHSAVAHYTLSGRHRSRHLSVRADVVGRHLPALMFAFLIGLAAVTVGLALLAYADGAGHPATMASVVVAIVILLGGPRLLARVRRRAERETT